jgi:amidase
MSRFGLPIGMELSGKLGDEATVLALAAQLQRAQDWKNQRPQIAGDKI